MNKKDHLKNQVLAGGNPVVKGRDCEEVGRLLAEIVREQNARIVQLETAVSQTAGELERIANKIQGKEEENLAEDGFVDEGGSSGWQDSNGRTWTP